MSDLQASLNEYSNQLELVNEALKSSHGDESRESLATLKSDLEQLILLTQESLNAQSSDTTSNISGNKTNTAVSQNNELDDEYALFMQEMADTGAYETTDNDQPSCSKESDKKDENSTSDIEEELSTLLGMKCAVYHTHKWGGQPSLHNAMVSAVEPRQDDDQFQDLQVRVLFTHPTHAEMLPCPFYLDGECKFDDEKCRYSHGDVVALSNLKEAIEPDFDGIKVGSRILMKLKPPDDEDISITKRSTEKYSLWHRAIVKSVDLDKRTCIAKTEQGVKTGEKRKSGSDEVFLKFEEIFPLNVENESSSDSDDSLSDTEYPDSKSMRADSAGPNRDLLIDKSLQNNAPPIGGWEKHTRGIGSKIMLAMGYVPGTGLGAAGDGRLQPVEARVLPVGKSLDKCMEISEKYASKDPLKLESKLKRLQQKEEERNKRAYEREKERERKNVFNFLNRTIGNQGDIDAQPTSVHSADIKQSTSKDLNIEQFKITEDAKKLEREILKLNSSLAKYPSGSPGHRALASQILDRNKELSSLKNRDQQISKEQRHRKDKQKMTVF